MIRTALGFILALVLAGCGSSCQPAPASRAQLRGLLAVEPAAGVSVRDFGAIGDGVADDRAAIQAALAAGAGSVVRIPAGRYLVTKAPQGAWCLTVPANTTVRGETGTVLVQAPGIASSVRLLEVDAQAVTIEDLVLDGQRAAQAPDEHRAGVFASGAVGLQLRRVTAREFTGDGIYIHIGSNSVVIDDVTATNNTRNGLTLGGGTSGTTVLHSRFTSNGRQQFDSEPGTGQVVNNVMISTSVFDGGTVSGDYVLTVSGSGAANRSKGWTIERNAVVGAVNVVWATDVIYRNNRSAKNAGAKPSLTIYRSCDRVLVEDNDLIVTGTAPSVVEVFGTGIGEAPDHVTIERNLITTTAPAHGIHIVTARDVRVLDNVIRGPGIATPFLAGVYARATVAGEDIRMLVVRRNLISDFGAVGVVAATSPGKLGTVVVESNVFEDTGGGSMASAMAFDTAADTRQADNLLAGGCGVMVARAPVAPRTAWGTGDRWVVAQ